MSGIFQSHLISQFIPLVFCAVVGVSLIVLAHSSALPPM